jgi:hypothetical protein
MNIFFLDWDLKKSAQYHCDKHLIKMLIEYSQLLCSAHWVTGSSAPYKLTHKNHPCAIWTRESLSNYLTLCEFGLELSKEYTFRYGKRHKSQEVIEWCITNWVDIPDIGITDPPKAMPDEFKTDDVISSYRNYYKFGKREICSWKNREVPSWF